MTEPSTPSSVRTGSPGGMVMEVRKRNTRIVRDSRGTGKYRFDELRNTWTTETTGEGMTSTWTGEVWSLDKRGPVTR